jgi:hypothetical protein
LEAFHEAASIIFMQGISDGGWPDLHRYFSDDAVTDTDDIFRLASDREPSRPGQQRHA